MNDENAKISDEELAQSVENAKSSIDAEQAADSSSHKSNTNTPQIPLIVAFVLLWAGVLWFQGAKLINPYYGIEPFADRELASSYLYELMDDLEAWRIENGDYPDSLEMAIQQNELPDVSSKYTVAYLNLGDTVDLELIGPSSYVVRVSSSEP